MYATYDKDNYIEEYNSLCLLTKNSNNYEDHNNMPLIYSR